MPSHKEKKSYKDRIDAMFIYPRTPTAMEIATQQLVSAGSWGSPFIPSKPNGLLRFTDSTISWDTPIKDPPKPKPKPKPKRNKRVGIGNSLRFKIFMRDNFTCQYCGVNKEEDGVKLEVDHIIPVSKGGTNKKSNLTTACFRCNRGKSNKVIPNTKASNDKETIIEATKIVDQRPRDASLRSTEIDLTSIGSSSLISTGTLTLGDSLAIADSGATTIVFDDNPITILASGRQE